MQKYLWAYSLPRIEQQIKQTQTADRYRGQSFGLKGQPQAHIQYPQVFFGSQVAVFQQTRESPSAKSDAQGQQDIRNRPGTAKDQDRVAGGNQTAQDSDFFVRKSYHGNLVDQNNRKRTCQKEEKPGRKGTDTEQFKARQHPPISQDGLFEPQLTAAKIGGQVILILDHGDRRIRIVHFIRIMHMKIQGKWTYQNNKKQRNKPGRCL